MSAYDRLKAAQGACAEKKVLPIPIPLTADDDNRTRGNNNLEDNEVAELNNEDILNKLMKDVEALSIMDVMKDCVVRETNVDEDIDIANDLICASQLGDKLQV